MKQGIAMFVVFGLAVLVAGYVALAPLSDGSPGILSALDILAGKLVAVRGPRAAVLGLLGAGALLSLAIAALGTFLSADRKARPKPHPRKAARRPEPGPVWRPEPAVPGQEPVEPLAADRIAGLRRRALSEAVDDNFVAPAPWQTPPDNALPIETHPNHAASIEEPPAPPPTVASPVDGENPYTTLASSSTTMPRPVVLVRKPRERTRDWFGDASWLGGLPRLGDAEWPRDVGGTPLPFAAQIDLAEIAAACPESPLPRQGALAFFLGTGAVVAVADTTHDFSEPPTDLPPAFDEGGYPFPPAASRLSRHFFPFWPVEPVVLDLPADLLDHRDGYQDEAIEQAMADSLARYAAPRAFALTADDGTLWWHSVAHLAERLHAALENASRLVVLREDGVRHAEETLHNLGGDPDDPALDAAREDLARRQASLASIEAQRDALPDVIAALDQFAANRNPWEPLTAEERSLVEDLLAELQGSYRDVVRYHAPHGLDELASLSIRAMITGAPDAFAALPDDQLERINRGFRLPSLHQHQMFGLGGCQQTARDDHRGDILLLQLGYDDMMEWRWGDMGLFQFWINPEDAAAGNWSAAQLTFECA